ncbi:MAG: SHOCT domain-containing protein [Proteobacteria bacterium]|nr:SHOCT domain-containing protein [Pseudomonadota bacterium]
MNIKTTLVTILLSAFVFGCAGTPVHFSDAPLDKLDLSRGRKVTAKAAGIHLFSLIPIGINERHLDAYEKLQIEAGNDYLTNIYIQDSWSWVVIGHKYSTTLTADAYPEKSNQLSEVMSGKALTDKLNKLKILRESNTISEIEYEQAKQRVLNNIE